MSVGFSGLSVVISLSIGVRWFAQRYSPKDVKQITYELGDPLLKKAEVNGS